MTSSQDRFAALARALAERPDRSAERPDRPVRLLLDTDAEIGKSEGTPEGRVGFTPDQGARLIAVSEHLGLPIEWAVVEGAGLTAGFQDAAYRDAGARVLTIPEIASGGFAPDIVHALKEPAPHEADFPGPYTRIGAAHIEVAPPGIVAMVRARNVGLLIGGRTTGGRVHQVLGGHPLPIVAAMSRFAGRVSGEQVRDLTTTVPVEHQRCMVVGAGVAGIAAAQVLLDAQRGCSDPQGEVLFVDVRDSTIERARRELESLYPGGDVRYRFHRVTGDRPLEPSDFADEVPFHSVVLAAAGRNRAPRVAHLNDLVGRFVERGGTVADIGIDQGSCITFHDDGLDPKTKVDVFRKHFGAAGRHYFGEINMPRAYPHEASEVHGEMVLPYLLALAALHAETGSWQGACARLLELPAWNDQVAASAGLFDRYLHELRSGIQLYAHPETRAITVPEEHRGSWFTPGNAIHDTILEANAASARSGAP
jgi:alanine dehydrogenase